MASGGFMTTNEKAEHYMEKMLNQALGIARRYDEACQSSKCTNNNW